MEIYIDGQALDLIAGQDVDINWTNIRFDSAIADAWSTDIQLAQTERNTRILSACGLLDRGPMYNRKVKCLLVLNNLPKDGYLHITSITPYEITATCYLTTIPYELFDKQLSDYYPSDTDQTIYRWDRYTPITNNIVDDIGFWYYEYNSRYYSNIIAQYHPCVRAERINQLIQTAENITLPTLDNNLYTMATSKVVCPENQLQVLSSYMRGQAVDVGGKDIPFVGGQHITNDVKCEWSYDDTSWLSDWSDIDPNPSFRKWLSQSHRNVIKFNRSGKMNIKVYAVCNRSTTIVVKLYKNGVDVTNQYVQITTPVWQLSSAPTNIENYLSFAGYNVTYQKDDEFSIRYHYVSSGAIAGDEVYATIIMEHSGYDITDDDYSEDLQYIGMPFGFGFCYHSGNNDVPGWTYITGGNGRGPAVLNHSYCYFGVWANMPSCSVRDWLTGMCWVHNRKTKLEGYSLTFTSPDQTIDIDGEITEIRTYDDSLAQKNIIKYRDDNRPVWFRVDNEFLDDETDIYEAPFGTSINLYGIAWLEQYTFTDEMTEPNAVGATWVKDVNVDFEDLGLMLFTCVQEGGTYQLERAPDLTKFSLDRLNTMSCTIECYTPEALNCDWVRLRGRKFLVKEGSVDTSTGISKLECIEYWTRYNGGCAAPTFNITFYPSVTDCIAQYNLYDNTEAGTFTLTVNGDTYQLVAGTSQWITISGLDADTMYTVTVKGHNSCGSIDDRYYFTTLASMPPTVEITNIFNIDSSSAVFDINITDNSI